MMQSATQPPTTTPGVDVPSGEPDVATGAPPALPLLSAPTTAMVASQGPVPVAAGLPATGAIIEVPLASGSILVVIGVAAVLATCGRRVRHS